MCEVLLCDTEIVIQDTNLIITLQDLPGFIVQITDDNVINHNTCTKPPIYLSYLKIPCHLDPI